MNVLLGTAFIVLGLVFSNQVIALFGVLPIWALSGFLAYAGIRHAMLIVDLSPGKIAVAVACGLVGVVTGNLVYTTALALVSDHVARAMEGRSRGREDDSAVPVTR
jgi:hypothetical protein